MGWRLWFVQKGRRRSSLGKIEVKRNSKSVYNYFRNATRPMTELTNGVENSTDEPSGTETSGQTGEAQSGDDEGDGVRWEALEGILMETEEARRESERENEKGGREVKRKGVREGRVQSFRRASTRHAPGELAARS